MLFNNIIERRKVTEGKHNTILEMTSQDYEKRYKDYNDEIAMEIIRTHFIERGDDGKPSHVSIKKDEDNGMVRIYVNATIKMYN